MAFHNFIRSDPAAQRVALVTGGASGLGRACAQRFLQDGMTVEIWGRTAEALADAAAELRRFGSIGWRAVDVSRASDVAQAARAAQSQHGRIDVLFNGAGMQCEVRPLTEMSIEDWQEGMAVNLHSVFYTCKAFVPGMVSRGHGRIVNCASMAGKEGNPLQSGYSAAKAGVIALTKSLAKEIATSGVTVNCIAPTVFDTPMLRRTQEETPASVTLSLSKIPMRRMGRPEEAAAMVSWIASDACSFTTGFTFDLSGGRATY